MPSPGVLIVSAPSGAGKTSLTQALVAARNDVGLTVSHTTRSQRPGERDGVHYHFVDHGVFEAMIGEDAFVEHAEVFGNHYGTSVAAIETQLGSGRHAILDIDWQGARRVREKFPDARSVFVMPPSLDVLRQRLLDRGQDSDETIARRMLEAQSEMDHKDEYDRIIINEDFETALAELQDALNELIDSA